MQLNNFIKFSKIVKLCGKDAEEFEIARYWIFQECNFGNETGEKKSFPFWENGDTNVRV